MTVHLVERATAEAGPLTVPPALAESDVAYLAADGRPVLLNRGQVLDQAAHGHELAYLVRRGRLRIFQRTATGREVTLGTLRDGQILGLGALLGHSNEGLYAEALDQAHLYVLEGRRLLEALPARPTALAAVIGQVGSQLVQVEQQLGRMSQQSTSARLGRHLFRLATEFGDATPDGARRVPPGWTRAALARQIGCSRETVSRLLLRFEKQGLIRRSRRRIELLDPAAFAATYDVLDT
jgi:CRP/FNR family transcriptional regulator